MIGDEKRTAIRPIHVIRPVSSPCSITDSVLVQNQGNSTATGEPEERPRVTREPGRAEVQEVEVGPVVRETRNEPLKLRSPASRRLHRLGNAVVAIEDPWP